MRSLFILIFAYIISMSNILAQSPCNPDNVENFPCPNVGCDNPGAPWFSGGYYVELPQFPNCSLRVDFCYRVCNTNPYTVQTQITAIHMLYPGAGCSPCCDALRSYYQGPNGYKKYIILAWQEVTRKLYESFANSVSDKSTLYCPNNKVEYTSTIGGCVAACETQINYFEDGIWKTKVSVHNISCTDYGCCFYKREYCLDPNTEEIVIGPTTLDTYGEITDCAGRQFPEAYPVECYQGTNTIFEECEEDCVDPSEL